MEVEKPKEEAGDGLTNINTSITECVGVGNEENGKSKIEEVKEEGHEKEENPSEEVDVEMKNDVAATEVIGLGKEGNVSMRKEEITEDCKDMEIKKPKLEVDDVVKNDVAVAE